MPDEVAREEASTISTPGNGTDIPAGGENGAPETAGQIYYHQVVNDRSPVGGPSLTNGNGSVHGNGFKGMHGLTNGNGAINGNGLVGGRGLTNGNGAVNGNGLQLTHSLVNGNGAVNGNGLISNQGLINGNGLINGQGRGRKAQMAADPAGESGPIHTRKRRRNRLGALVAIAAVAVLMLPVLAVILHPASPRMSVDGNFGDWQGIPIISDGPDPSAPFPDLDIVRYSTTVSGDSAFFYLEVAGRMLSGKESTGGVDAVNVFLDMDKNASTGYTIHGIGADLRLEAHGWNGQVQGCTLYKFSPKRIGLDWNGWSSVGGFAAIAQGSKIEMAAARGALGIHGSAVYRALFQIMDSRSGAQDLGRALAGPSGGALHISQTPVDLAAIPVPSESQHILTLRLTALAGNIQVRELAFSRCGNVSAQDVGVVRLVWGQNVLNSSFLDGLAVFATDLTVVPATPLTLELYVELFSSATAGRLFGAVLAGNDAVVLRKGTATVADAGPTSYYVGAAPTNITIDGAFGDWSPVTSHPDPAGDCSNADVDLLETRAAKNANSLSVLARVDGSMLGGGSSPETPMSRPVPSSSRPSGPSPVQPAMPVLMALDTVKVFIDSDDSALTGYRITDLDLGADYALVVTGAGGNIISQNAYSWSNSTGVWKSIGSFAAAKDPARMEMQAPLALLGLNATATVRVQVYASDWTGKGDRLDQSMLLADPLQLTYNGTVFYSSDGSSWTNETNIGQWGSQFTDLCNDSNGYQYAINSSGAVYRSTGNWSSWTSILNATLTNATAIATNGTSFYAIETDGDVYNTTSGKNWTKAGNITCNNDTVDMCIDSSGNLYALRSDPNDTVFNSSNGGKNWTAWGNRTVGGLNSTINNTAIVYGTGWGGTKYIFILQSNGDLRYDTNGNTSSPWRVINSTDNSSKYVDLDSIGAGAGNGAYYIWVLKLNGTVYQFKFNTTAPNGNWTTNFMSTNVSDAFAINVNLVPEFKDALLPMTGMVAVFILIRSRRPKRSER